MNITFPACDYFVRVLNPILGKFLSITGQMFGLAKLLRWAQFFRSEHFSLLKRKKIFTYFGNSYMIKVLQSDDLITNLFPG